MSQKKTLVRATGLKFEDGAVEIGSSPGMKPYDDLFSAMLRDQDTRPFADRIAALPLEERQLWRVVSALKWAFADFDSLTVQIDADTLSDGQRKKVSELLAFRPLQFCLLLKAFWGVEKMKEIMTAAIRGSE